MLCNVQCFDLTSFELMRFYYVMYSVYKSSIPLQHMKRLAGNHVTFMTSHQSYD
jgi:hypothetical protein